MIDIRDSGNQLAWNTTFRAALAALLLSLTLCGTVLAEGTDSGEWEFQLAPLYIWGSSMTGDMRVPAGIEAPIDMDFGTIAENLESIFTVHFEAWKNKWGVLTDFMYVDLGNNDTTVPTGTIDVSIKNTIGKLDVGREVGEGDVALLLGVQYMKVATSLTLPSGIALGPDESWWDPMLGVVWRPRITDRWSFMGRADIGGFGVSSDLVWGATALFGYRFTDHVGLLFGYKVLDYDYEKDDYAYKVMNKGPGLALNFNW